MAECRKCRTAIRGETGIRCQGVCDKVYHCTQKCSGVDQYSAKVLENNNFVRYICDDCIQYIHNVDLMLRAIQDSVGENRQNLVEYKTEFEMSLKQNEKEIKILLEAIEQRYEERLKKMDSVQKICEKNIKEVKKMCGNLNEVENQNKEMCDTICNKIKENNEQMGNEIKKTIKETNEKQNKMSFADAVRKHTELPEMRKQVPLIVKPKEKQTMEKTKQDLNKVDPVNLKITNVENRKNGTLIIQTENNEERERVKNAIENEMRESYDIRVPNENDMTIVITDMTFKFNENELIEKLKLQNNELKESEFKIVKSYEFKKYNRIIYNTKIKVNKETYTKVMSAQRLNVGWEKCRIYDGTDIMQCFKCQGYNHKSEDCRNEDVCYKCHGPHKSKECNKEIIVKCINCIRANQKLNIGLDENHVTANRECPVYQNKLNNKKKRLGLIA